MQPLTLDNSAPPRSRIKRRMPGLAWLKSLWVVVPVVSLVSISCLLFVLWVWLQEVSWKGTLRNYLPRDATT